MTCRRGGMRELRHVYAELAEVSKDYHEARQQANLDKLTGLYNRRFFDERLNRLLFEHQPFCLAMVDLDDFKRVNDTFGHQTGDVVLKRVSKLGMRLLGDHGWVCRYGGEELVVLLVNPDIHFCQMLLEQFRKGVESLDWREPELRITFSCGLVASQAGGGWQDAAGDRRCRGVPRQTRRQEPHLSGKARGKEAGGCPPCRRCTAEQGRGLRASSSFRRPAASRGWARPARWRSGADRAPG